MIITVRFDTEGVGKTKICGEIDRAGTTLTDTTNRSIEDMNEVDGMRKQIRREWNRVVSKPDFNEKFTTKSNWHGHDFLSTWCKPVFLDSNAPDGLDQIFDAAKPLHVMIQFDKSNFKVNVEEEENRLKAEEEEAKRLKAEAEENGLNANIAGNKKPLDWIKISEGTNHSPNSYRIRWKNHLRPHINRELFSNEEHMRISALQKLHGNNWAYIAKIISPPRQQDTRTKEQIRWEWNNVVSKVDFSERLTVEQKIKLKSIYIAEEIRWGVLTKTKSN